MFTGLSTLREAEKAKQPPPEVSEKAKSLQAYLASKYTDGGEGAKKKKKKKKPKIADAAVIRIVDEDVSGFVAPATDAVEEEQDGELMKKGSEAVSLWSCRCNASTIATTTTTEGPLIANPEEAERALRFKDQVCCCMVLCTGYSTWGHHQTRTVYTSGTTSTAGMGNSGCITTTTRQQP